jgi:ABC-type transport system involved in multi-copper enzyme maturation permease subunit
MTFLPIVERELREGARRLSTRYIRLTVAGVALGLSLLQLLFLPLMQLGVVSGGAGFQMLTGYGLVICLLAGIFVTADCLSEEKREGTLGLLFLTDLRGYDVVLGKLASQYLTLGYALLAIIPSAALPILLGGVTGGEVWRVTLSLLNLLFCSLTAGLFASTLCRHAAAAMSLTAVIILAQCLGWPMIVGFADLTGATRGNDWYLWLSPMQAYTQAMDGSYTLASYRFWTALGCSHLFGWGLIAWASWRLPNSWQERALLPKFVPAAPPIKSALTDAPAAALPAPENTRITKRNRAHLDTEPLRWLIGEAPVARAITLIIASVWVVILVAIVVSNAPEGMLILLMYGRFLLFPMKILFAFQACRFFTETRRTGAFELLLSTPLGSRDLITAQWAMLRHVFLPAGIIILSTTLIAAFILAVLNYEHEGALPMTGFGLLMLAWALGEACLDFFAMGMLGMWLALTMRKPHLAAGATILFVLVLPGMMCGIGLIVDIVLIIIFGAKLRQDFRESIREQR